MFTDYPNALGYASVGASKGGSRTLYGGGLAVIGSMAQPVDFAPGSYHIGNPMTLAGYANDCGQGSQSEGFGNTSGEVIISAISATRIQGSLTGANYVQSLANSIAFSIDFDIPLFSYPDGGPPPWNLGIGGCCLE
jgi:hypothetical protein